MRVKGGEGVFFLDLGEGSRGHCDQACAFPPGFQQAISVQAEAAFISIFFPSVSRALHVCLWSLSPCTFFSLSPESLHFHEFFFPQERFSS